MDLCNPFRNPLSYPAGYSPGFDPSHVAAKGAAVRLSCVAVGQLAGSQNYRNLLTGKLATVSAYSYASPSIPAIDAITGPNAWMFAPSSAFTFSGMPAVTDTEWTAAAIVRIPATGGGGNSAVLPASSGTSWSGLFYSTSGVGIFRPSFGGQYGVNSLTIGQAYFIAVSTDGVSKTNTIAVNLATGQIVAAPASWYQSNVSDGSYTVQCSGLTGFDGYRCSQSTAMYAAKFMSAAELLQWAADPWAFWYPSVNSDFLVGITSGSSYSISSSYGSYTYTGKTQNLNSSRSVSIVQGSYSQTGESQTLQHGPNFTVPSGVYSVTGKPQTMLRGIKTTASQGSYSVTGESQILGVETPTVQGSYGVTGKPQSFAVALSDKPPQGSYGVSGYPQVLSLNRFGFSTNVPGHKFISDVGNMTEINA